MRIGEIFATYGLPVIAAALTAMAGFVGTQLKRLYEKYVNDKTKEAVARTCVKAVEQLYHDLSGPEKLQKAQEGVVQMLNEKGILISDLEMNLLIESVVAEFNYGFAKTTSGQKPKDLPKNEPDPDAGGAYTEEGGSR